LKKNKIVDFFFQGHTEYIAHLAPLFALSLLIFLSSTAMGYSLGRDVQPWVFEDVLSHLPDPRRASGLDVFLGILSNNVVACIIFLASGLVLGIPPLLFMALNGFYVGYVAFNAAHQKGIGFVLASLLPHGVIEIPAIVLCSAMGVGLGYTLLQRLFKSVDLQGYFLESIRVFLFRIIPLLVLAAGIETAVIYLML